MRGKLWATPLGREVDEGAPDVILKVQRAMKYVSIHFFSRFLALALEPMVPDFRNCEN